ncbi:hypothetical protein BGX33_009161 [Mortierella sp. NVP41]|nr:hypothetical protein BGX33_009161 [Mortierella sp. NVP41]
MACASAGDYFVAWGGYTSDFGGDSNKILYFNFVANQWFDETSINNAIATTTAELLAQVKTKHEQRRERIRQEREADLQRFREQWQTGTPEKYS